MALLDQSSMFSLTMSLEVAKKIYDRCSNKGEINKSKNNKTVISKKDEVYIKSKKRNNPMFSCSSAPKRVADTGTKRKRSRSTYRQNILQRGDAYQTNFDKKSRSPSFQAAGSCKLTAL